MQARQRVCSYNYVSNYKNYALKIVPFGEEFREKPYDKTSIYSFLQIQLKTFYAVLYILMQHPMKILYAL